MELSAIYIYLNLTVKKMAQKSKTKVTRKMEKKKVHLFSPLSAPCPLFCRCKLLPPLRQCTLFASDRDM